MADRPRFGPSGVPPIFRLMGAKLADVPKLLKAEGLDAFEYEAVRWGQTPQIKREDAQALRVAAQQSDVLLSLHGSYFINLSGEQAVVEASKRRLIACATAAEWMGAYVVVFHTGFYGRNSKTEAYKKTVDAIRDVIKILNASGVEKVKLGPETMGRHSQFGSLDEILSICQEVERTQLVVDWSHIHARTGGGLRTVEDFRDIAVRAEEKLGTEAMRNMHCHFSKIEYTYKAGERRHHVLDAAEFGPDFEKLAEVIVDLGIRPCIICETPILDVDAKKMQQTLGNHKNRRN
ncbi:MAG: TIM barrel protein [Candidatus Bathyarchaeia archaeon]